MKITTSDLWLWLCLCGVIMLVVGMFIFAETYEYTGLTEGTITEIDGNNIVITYIDPAYDNLASVTNTVDDNLHSNKQLVVSADVLRSVYDASNTDAPFVKGDLVMLKYMPKNHSKIVASLDPQKTTAYILISIGSAMTIAFLFTYIFAPKERIY